MTAGVPGAGRLLSPAALREANSSWVVQALLEASPLSRADLARRAGKSRAVVGNIVQALLDDGVLEEGPTQAGGRRGAPSRPVRLSARAGLGAVLSLRDDGVRGALVNARGEVLGETVLGYDPSRAEDVLAAMVRCVSGLVDVSDPMLVGVGVAVPGLCNAERGEVLTSTHVPALVDYPLVTRLRSRLGCNVLLDNDSRVQALGDAWFGVGRGHRSFLSLQTGEGLGAGVVVERRALRGGGGLAGEVGHMSLGTGVSCRCGLVGCWETVATLRWLRAEAAAAGVPRARRTSSPALAALAAQGDGRAAALLERYADNLAQGVASLVMTFNPEVVVLHGDVADGGELLRAAVEQRTRERVLPHLRDQVRLEVSGLGERALLLGAAGLLLSHAHPAVLPQKQDAG